MPVRLPKIPGTGAVAIDSTVTFELAAVDVGFDVFDTSQSPPAPGSFEAPALAAGIDVFAATPQAVSSSARGQGPMLGLGLDLTARGCSSCKWFGNWSYWYRFLPSLDVDRPRSLFPELVVVSDRLRLSREAHEISSRVGHAVSAGPRRYEPFIGVLYRKTKLELEDEVRFEPAIGPTTTLEALSRFDSETVQALVGFYVQWSKSLSGRFETALGEGDDGVSFQISWNPGLSKPPKFPKREKKRERQIIGIVSQLTQLRKDFLDGWNRLTLGTAADGSPAYSSQEVRDLLESSRDRFLEILSYRQLTAMQYYVDDEVSGMLSAIPGESAGIYRSEIRVAASSAPAAGRFLPAWFQAGAPLDGDHASDRVKEPFLRLIDKIKDLFASRDIAISLDVRTIPPGASVLMYTKSRVSDDCVAEIEVTGCKTVDNIFRGKYLIKVTKKELAVECDTLASQSCTRLNLIDESGPVLQCELYTDAQGCCKLTEAVSGDLRCPDE